MANRSHNTVLTELRNIGGALAKPLPQYAICVLAQHGRRAVFDWRGRQMQGTSQHRHADATAVGNLKNHVAMNCPLLPADIEK
jgi:hypothetical protein